MLTRQKFSMIIVVEGIDGTGKTTVSKKVAQASNYNYRHYPVDYCYWYDIAQDKHKAMALDMAANAVDKSKDWILDRYLPSSLVYGMSDPLYSNIKKIVPLADYNILLCCDPDVAYKRMLARGLDKLDPGKEELIIYQQRYLELDIWDKTVDTTHKTIQEVYNDVKSFTKACVNCLL